MGCCDLSLPSGMNCKACSELPRVDRPKSADGSRQVDGMVSRQDTMSVEEPSFPIAEWYIDKIYDDLPSLDKKQLGKVYKYVRRLRHGIDVEPTV